MGDRPVLYVCEGEDCLGRDHERLVEAMEDHARVRLVRCQKICEGPVCGTYVEGRLTWFGSVDSEKSRDALRAALQGEPLARALERRVVSKREGRLRR